MYLQQSYLHVLKTLDSSWGQDSTYSGSGTTTPRGDTKFRGRRRRTSRSFSRSRSSTSGSFAEGHCPFYSSSESGRFSEDAVNSGYYGDDEVERCRCAKCLRAAAEWARNKPVISEYDVISIDLTIDSTTPVNNTAVRYRDVPYCPEKLGIDDYIIIPSSREEFCAGKFFHSTPQKLTDSRNHITNFTSPRPLVEIAEDQVSQPETPCKLLEEERFPARALVPSRYRTANSEASGCWWRENIAWQLRQRNKTQVQNFALLQTESRPRTRSKLRINKELADYLNRNGDCRPQADLAQIAIETDPLDRSEVVRAIRAHSGTGEPERRHSVARLATTFLRRQGNQITEKRNEDSDSSACGPRKITCNPRDATPRNANDRGRRLYIPRWRSSVVNQLEMRNFLECKYFTDVITRTTMSQLTVSSQTESVQSTKDLEEYDVISDHEVTSQTSASTLVDSGSSKSSRNSFMRLFTRRRSRNHR